MDRTLATTHYPRENPHLGYQLSLRKPLINHLKARQDDVSVVLFLAGV
jgi:hypothetical protein